MEPKDYGIDPHEEIVDNSVGALRVRIGFNPDNNEEVAEIKALTAALINICESLKPKDGRLAALAQTAYEEAAMWAVKAATA